MVNKLYLRRLFAESVLTFGMACVIVYAAFAVIHKIHYSYYEHPLECELKANQ